MKQPTWPGKTGCGRAAEHTGNHHSRSQPTMRCCIYKERAIVTQRVQMAMGGHPGHTTQVEVLPIACDECPVSQVTVSDACRGCIAHRCANACP